MTPLSRPFKIKQRDSPDYGPGTIDLFGDYSDEIEKTITDGLQHIVKLMIDNMVNKHTTEPEKRLLQELTIKVLGILGDLDQHENSESQ